MSFFKERQIDKEGNLYAKQGTDGCDYIQRKSFDYVPCTHFYTQQEHSYILQQDFLKMMILS